MARALVVYEPAAVNTRTAAAAVAAGLGTRVTTTLVEVSAAPRVLPTSVDLLVVGGPTHGLRLTRGLRTWLSRLGRLPSYVTAATFETRPETLRLPASAARGARRRLARHGVAVVARPKTFYGDDNGTGLLPGEEQRARAWGAGLAENLTLSRGASTVG